LPDPLLAPLAALAAGIAAARFAGSGETDFAAALAALIALTWFGYWRNARRAALASLLAALVFAGALIGVAHRPGPAPELDAAAREVVILSGCVVEPPALLEDREQFVLELEPGARARVSLFLRGGERPPKLHYGMKVEVDARVRPARNFGNPGSFDYVGYLARQGIYWTASVPSGGQVHVLPGECGSAFRRAIFRLRVAALDRLEHLYRGDSYNTAMMEAILIGDSSKLQKVWTEDFRRTGTYHALVISGLHVSVLAAFLLFLLRLCFVPQGPALAITTAAAWLYALVSGWQAPVVRSAAGFVLFAAAKFFFRRTRLLNLIAAVGIGFLVFDPEQMFEASFQLSFLSVLAIGALAVPVLERTSAPLARGLRGLADKARDPRLEPRVASFRVELRLAAETFALWTPVTGRVWLAIEAIVLRAIFYCYEIVLISAMVQVGLALPMALYFHRISLSGLSANVLIVPLMSAVVPVGFVAVFTGWQFAAAIAGRLLAASQWIAGLHARWEPGWRVPDPPLWLAAAFTAALIGFALALAARRHIPRLAAGLACGALFVLILRHPFAPKVERGLLELTAIDVGQGDSLFLAFPDGKLMVLDGGGIASFGPQRLPPRLDIGEDVVSPYLWSRSIRRLDVLALSHAHEDHIGGMAALIANFHPRELWVGAMPDSPEWIALRRTAVENGVRIVPLEAGAEFAYGGARLRVLAPAPGYQVLDAARNNDSLVLRAAYGERSFLLAGDAERQVEWRMLDSGALGRSDVLKVAHHGSNTSTQQEMLDAVRPLFAVISVGFENSFRLPSREVLKRLSEAGARAFRTDELGLISIRTDGRRLEVDTGQWAAARPRLYSPF
jgi:competence protein ComEC